MIKSLLILFFITEITCAQQINKPFWHLTVVDSVTSKSLQGASVLVLNNLIFVTNNNGFVNINNDILKTGNVVTLSNIGYKTMYFKLSAQLPDSLKLIPSVTALNEVAIKSKLKIESIGDVHEHFDGGYSSEPNQEIAEFIPNNKKISGQIISLEFSLLNEKGGIEKPFKVNIYEKVEGSLYPGKKLITDSLLVYNKKKLRNISVDISKYNIQIPKAGFFVGFETLSPLWYDNDWVTLEQGHKYLRVPGIKGHFNNHQFKFDDTPRNGIKYGLYRDIRPDDSWAIFEIGTDFAIGATIIPDN